MSLNQTIGVFAWAAVVTSLISLGIMKPYEQHVAIDEKTMNTDVSASLYFNQTTGRVEREEGDCLKPSPNSLNLAETLEILSNRNAFDGDRHTDSFVALYDTTAERMLIGVAFCAASGAECSFTRSGDIRVSEDNLTAYVVNPRSIQDPTQLRVLYTPMACNLKIDRLQLKARLN
jgi:hypothetical protein